MRTADESIAETRRRIPENLIQVYELAYDLCECVRKFDLYCESHPEQRKRIEAEHRKNLQRFETELESEIASLLHVYWDTNKKVSCRSPLDIPDTFQDFHCFPARERILAEHTIAGAMYQIGHWLEHEIKCPSAPAWYFAAATEGSKRAFLAIIPLYINLVHEYKKFELINEYADVLLPPDACSKIREEGCTCESLYGGICAHCLMDTAAQSLRKLEEELGNGYVRGRDVLNKLFLLADRFVDPRFRRERSGEEMFDVDETLCESAFENMIGALNADFESLYDLWNGIRTRFPDYEYACKTAEDGLRMIRSYEEAVLSGSCRARLELACVLRFLYANYWHVNTDEFIGWLRDQAESENSVAMFEYGLHLLKSGEPDEATVWFRLAGLKRHPIARILAAFESLDPKPGCDLRRFTRWVTASCVVNDAVACIILEILAPVFEKETGHDLMALFKREDPPYRKFSVFRKYRNANTD
jgi:hypothetical protein